MDPGQRSAPLPALGSLGMYRFWRRSARDKESMFPVCNLRGNVAFISGFLDHQLEVAALTSGIVSPPKTMVKSLPPGPQNVTLFGNKIIPDIIS